jgi:hypothetical protein
MPLSQTCRLAGLSICALVSLALPIASADEVIDGEALISAFDLSATEVKKLDSGEVVNFSGEPFESSKRELASDATVVIHQPLDVVLSNIKETTSLIPSRKILAHAEINSVDDFARVAYENTDRDYTEVKRLFAAKPGDDYNFSAGEYVWLDAKLAEGRGAGREKEIQVASEAMRHILQSRYDQYRAAGLKGIEGFLRKRGKVVDVSADLIKTTQTHQPAEKWFPDYYNVLMNYPEGADCCEHIFRWMKVKLAKKATFALTHTIIQKTDDHLLVTERYYYLNHSGNYGQIVLAWLPYKDDTYMGLAMSANTEVLDSFLGKMLRPFGRKEAEKMVTEVLTGIKSDIENTPANSSD